MEYIFNNTEKEFLKALGKQNLTNPLSSYMVIKSFVVTRNENIGIYCDLSDHDYYVFCLDAFALRASESSFNKVITSIILLNKLLQSNDIVCVDKKKEEMRQSFFFANIENGRDDENDKSLFKFKLKDDDRYHQLDRKKMEWRIFSDENYTTLIETIESIRFSNDGSTFLSPYLNSTMTLSSDLKKYIANNCLTDDELYKNKEANKTKWSLRISIGTAIVAVLTLMVNTIATIDARKNSVQANESSVKSVELSLKATELVNSIINDKNSEQTCVHDSLGLKTDKEPAGTDK